MMTSDIVEWWLEGVLCKKGIGREGRREGGREGGREGEGRREGGRDG